jgi:magnesium transporter
MNWHDIRDPNDPELDRLAAQYHLHPLHVEDCRHRNQSAKIEENEGYLFLVLKPLAAGPEGEVNVYDLDVFLGREFLITVQEDGGSKTAPLIDHVRANWGSARGDQLLYRIMDGVVDAYLPALDHFNDAIDDLQDQVLDNPCPATLQKLFAVKRALIQVRRVLVNMRDVAGHLQRIESSLIGRDMWPFLRDIYDHVARNLDLVETQRDLLSGALDIYLSSVANRTNQVMKVLTVLGTIALPAVIISGIYGMNVEGLPWKSSPHAFWLVSALIALISGALLVVLKIFRWF